jgi:hypothetical protein
MCRDVFICFIVDSIGTIRVIKAEKWGVMNIGRDRWTARRITARANPIVTREVSRDEARPLIAGARYPA